MTRDDYIAALNNAARGGFSFRYTREHACRKAIELIGRDGCAGITFAYDKTGIHFYVAPHHGYPDIPTELANLERTTPRHWPKADD